MSYYYWCNECGKSFEEHHVPLVCDECDGDIKDCEYKEK